MCERNKKMELVWYATFLEVKVKKNTKLKQLFVWSDNIPKTIK